jgi:hypothetical protein
LEVAIADLLVVVVDVGQAGKRDVSISQRSSTAPGGTVSAVSCEAGLVVLPDDAEGEKVSSKPGELGDCWWPVVAPKDWSRGLWITIAMRETCPAESWTATASTASRIQAQTFGWRFW